MDVAYNYYAFISYSHKDLKWAKWLQRRLEAYRLPTTVQGHNSKSKYLRPIFRDQTDLDTGLLKDELEKNLQQSQYLIVLCSKNAAHSQWMSQEVQRFIDWGRISLIIPFFIEDCTEIEDCMPQSLAQHFKSHPEEELLAVNIHEVGREKALIRLIARILNVTFDTLWQRHKKLLRQRIATAIITIPIISAIVAYLAIPVRLNVTLIDEGRHLPHPEDATLTVNGVDYSLSQLDTTVVTENLPGYWRLRHTTISFNSTYYESFATSCRMGLGLNNSFSIQLRRDDTFGVYAGHVIDEKGYPIQGALVTVMGVVSSTDSEGAFNILLPLEKQSKGTRMIVSKDGYKTQDEPAWASNDITIILHSSAKKEHDSN